MHLFVFVGFSCDANFCGSLFLLDDFEEIAWLWALSVPSHINKDCAAYLDRTTATRRADALLIFLFTVVNECQNTIFAAVTWR